MRFLQAAFAAILSLGFCAVVPCTCFSAGSTPLQFSTLQSRLALDVHFKAGRRAAPLKARGVQYVVALLDSEKSDKQLRDDALGFLSAEAGSSEEIELQLRKAVREADEAEARAERLRASLGTGKTAKAPKGNGLSAMLDPMAAAMLEGQGDYIRSCPVTEILESLEETRCGVMHAVSALQPSTLLGVAAVMYAISVLQLSQ